MFSREPLELQIIAFYDELEVGNALDTHIKKHKLGILLFTLGNIHPKYRSSLKVINLVLFATAPFIDSEKHGIDKILQPFISDLNTLATDGINVVVRGQEKKSMVHCLHLASRSA